MTSYGSTLTSKCVSLLLYCHIHSYLSEVSRTMKWPRFIILTASENDSTLTEMYDTFSSRQTSCLYINIFCGSQHPSCRLTFLQLPRALVMQHFLPCSLYFSYNYKGIPQLFGNFLPSDANQHNGKYVLFSVQPKGSLTKPLLAYISSFTCDLHEFMSRNP